MDILFLLTCLTLHLATPHELTSTFLFHNLSFGRVTTPTAQLFTLVVGISRFTALPTSYTIIRTLRNVFIAIVWRSVDVHQIFRWIFVKVWIDFGQFEFSILTISSVLFKLHVDGLFVKTFQMFRHNFEFSQLTIAHLRCAILWNTMATALSSRLFKHSLKRKKQRWLIHWNVRSKDD